MFDRNIDTICFSGGGTKALVFIGAVKALIDKNVIKLKNIKKFVGTSAGSIISFLLAIGYTPFELEEFVLNFNFSKLEPKNINCDDLFTNYGLDNGNNLVFKATQDKVFVFGAVDGAQPTPIAGGLIYSGSDAWYLGFENDPQ